MPIPAKAHPSIFSVGRALPPHTADQEALIEAFRRVWAKENFNLSRVEAFHRAVRVGRRHLALPLDAYEELEGFASRNRVFAEVAVSLGAEAITEALARAGLHPNEVDHLYFATITGLATPSIDARLVNRLGFRSDVKRTPIFGLGCVAGAAGIARASESVRAFPGSRAVLLSVELCSLTLQRDDFSVANLIASGLFGDGAAAVVLGDGAVPRGRTGMGDDGVPGDAGGRGPEIVATRSVFYPDTEGVMGWEVVDRGFKVLLSADVPLMVRRHLRGDVEGFLADHGLALSDIRHWVCHPGGPKVLEAFEETFELDELALARSWRSLEALGNLSSASVLFILGDTLEKAGAQAGDWGLLLAMGPGFCSELVLLRW